MEDLSFGNMMSIIASDHASELATLRAENERMREALEFIKDCHIAYDCRDTAKEALK